MKPLLHIPKNGGDEVNLIVPPTDCTELPKSSRFEYSELHSSCCQIYSIPGHICGILVSITKETAARIFSGADQGAANFQDYSSEMHLKLVATVCISLLDKLLCENHFSWEDLMVSLITSASDKSDILTLKCEPFTTVDRVGPNLIHLPPLVFLDVYHSFSHEALLLILSILKTWLYRNSAMYVSHFISNC